MDKVEALAADQHEVATFFCGGSRNFSTFIDLSDVVFVLAVDLEKLRGRLDQRPEDEFGGRPSERESIERLHESTEDTADGVIIVVHRPLADVVDDILQRAALNCGRPDYSRGWFIRPDRRMA